MRPYYEFLKYQGFRVFWDQDISAGQNWDHRLRGELEKTCCVVAFISTDAVNSANVLHEIAIAREMDKLIPLMLDRLNAKDLPLGVQQVHAIEQISLAPDKDIFEKLADAIVEKIAPSWMPRWLERIVRKTLRPLNDQIKEIESERDELQARLAHAYKSLDSAKEKSDQAIQAVADVLKQLNVEVKRSDNSSAQLRKVCEEIIKIMRVHG